MKKLLVTTALAGVILSGSAFAQTTITGELRIGYKAQSKGNAIGSSRGFVQENQINIQHKGKTNIGLDYAAGFSIENDGEQTGTLFNENTFIDLKNDERSHFYAMTIAIQYLFFSSFDIYIRYFVSCNK